MAKMGYPEPSVGPRVKTDCCGDVIQSLHRFHVHTCSCGNQSITGGADEPRLMRTRAAKSNGIAAVGCCADS
jgi:hypothetical protein